MNKNTKKLMAQQKQVLFCLNTSHEITLLALITDLGVIYSSFVYCCFDECCFQIWPFYMNNEIDFLNLFIQQTTCMSFISFLTSFLPVVNQYLGKKQLLVAHFTKCKRKTFFFATPFLREACCGRDYNTTDLKLL